MSKCDVCYVVSLGMSARMIFHTDLITELKKRYNSIAFLFPGENNNSFSEYEKKYNVDIYYSGFHSSFWSNEYMNFRRYIYEDVRQNPALYSKHLKSIYDYNGKNPWRKYKPYIYMFFNKLAKFNFIKTLFSFYEKSILINRRLKNLLKEIDPKVLISTYPVNYLEGSCIQSAKNMGITTVTQLLSWDNITCKGKFPAISDYYLVWGKIMQDELQEYYNIGNDRIFQTGVPHFDKSKELCNPTLLNNYISNLGLDSSKPYIFFGMSSPFFAPREINIVERLSDLVQRNIFGSDMQIIVRPHPQNVTGEMADESWLPRLEKLKSSRVGIDFPIMRKSNIPWNTEKEDLKKLSNLINGCSVVINSGSTLSIEGLIHDKPVILTLFDGDSSLKDYNSAKRLGLFIHLRKLINTRSVKVTYHYEELKKAILRFLENPDLNKTERETALYKECGHVDGESSSRITNAISEIVNKKTFNVRISIKDRSRKKYSELL